MPTVLRNITNNNSRTSKSEAVLPPALYVRELQMHQTKSLFSSQNYHAKILLKNRDFLVDPSISTVKWKANSDTKPKSSDRNRCISAAVGISLPSIDAKEKRGGGGGQMERLRETASHKCS